jgi:DNA invertase Pin-like site-specific DNA recombinase
MKKAYSYLRFSSTGQKDGDSLERQLRIATAYHDRALKNLPLDTSRADQGFSAYKGHQVSRGSLGHFIAEIRAGTIEPGSALIVENLDRISRQGPKIARKLLESIVDNGVEVHVVNLNKILAYCWENRPQDSVIVDYELNRAYQESLNKAERCGSAWTKKRHNANGKAAMSSRVPNWLKAEKGKPIQVIPERVKIVRQIFEWAAQGLGQYQIADKLIAAKIKPWGPKRNGIEPRWTPTYVRDILASRVVLGEYQPKKLVHDKNGKRRRIDDGSLVEDYYPQIIETDLWLKVNEARMAFALAKFGDALHAGRNKFSTANLFKRMVWDAVNNVPMTYRSYDGHPCLVTTYRKEVRANKISYPLFEDVILRFLKTADWKALADEGLNPESKKRRELVARELDSALKVRSRYEALLDDAERDMDDYTLGKYKSASAEVKRLQSAYSALGAEISASRTGSDLLAKTKGIEFIRIDRDADEGRSKLRLFLAQRIERIEISFNVTILSAPDRNRTVAGISPGKGQTLVRIIFKSGAQKLAILDTGRKRLSMLDLS